MWLWYSIDVRICKWLVATCKRQVKIKYIAIKIITLMIAAKALIKRQ